VDTREKIISEERLPELLASGSWVVVVGRFDPMTAKEAERLAEFGRLGKVLGIVLEDEEALFPAAARAVLVASLRDVSAVLVAHAGEWKSLLPSNAAFSIVEDLVGEGARRREFIECVLNRQRQE
jgi:hypothetical protein